MVLKSGINHTRERGSLVSADLHGPFEISAFQDPFYLGHKFRPLCFRPLSVIEQPFKKDRDGDKGTDQQDVHRETTDLE